MFGLRVLDLLLAQLSAMCFFSRCEIAREQSRGVAIC